MAQQPQDTERDEAVIATCRELGLSEAEAAEHVRTVREYAAQQNLARLNDTMRSGRIYSNHSRRY